MNRFFLTVCFLLMITISGFAASNTSSMSVSVTVVTNCTVSAAPLAFGNNASALNGTASVACSNTAPAAITLGQGSNATASSTYTETGSTTSLTAATKGGNDAVMVTVTF